MPDARRQIIVFLFTGDPCGLVQSNGRYAFDYEAITETTTTCAVDMSHVRKLTISDPDVAEAVEEKMSRTDARLTEQLVAIGQLNAKERVVHFLRRLSQSYAERGMPTQPLLLPMTRLDIADHLGMRLETLSRVLTGLRRRQLIDLQDANTVVLNGRATELLGAALR
jgi:CRP/FNR family transcriptional regulator